MLILPEVALSEIHFSKIQEVRNGIHFEFAPSQVALSEIHFSKSQGIQMGIHSELAQSGLPTCLNPFGFYSVEAWRCGMECAHGYYDAHGWAVVVMRAGYSLHYAPSDSDVENSAAWRCGMEFARDYYDAHGWTVVVMCAGYSLHYAPSDSGAENSATRRGVSTRFRFAPRERRYRGKADSVTMGASTCVVMPVRCRLVPLLRRY